MGTFSNCLLIRNNESHTTAAREEALGTQSAPHLHNGRVILQVTGVAFCDLGSKPVAPREDKKQGAVLRQFTQGDVPGGH